MQNCGKHNSYIYIYIYIYIIHTIHVHIIAFRNIKCHDSDNQSIVPGSRLPAHAEQTTPHTRNWNFPLAMEPNKIRKGTQGNWARRQLPDQSVVLRLTKTSDLESAHIETSQNHERIRTQVWTTCEMPISLNIVCYSESRVKYFWNRTYLSLLMCCTCH